MSNAPVKASAFATAMLCIIAVPPVTATAFAISIN